MVLCNDSSDVWRFAIASDVLSFWSMGCMGLADVDLGISMW